MANAYGAITVATLRSPTILAGAEATDRGALPLTEEEVAYLRYGLELVADFGGTAAWAFANQGYRDFAGKSGTAEDTNDQEHVLFVAYGTEGGAWRPRRRRLRRRPLGPPARRPARP